MTDANVPRVNICPRCEKELTGKLTYAFTHGGYKVDLEYCNEHDS